MVCSCDSITPAVWPSTKMAWISSSVTTLPLLSLTPSTLSRPRVDADSNQTKGLVARARKLMGREIRRARASGWVWPRRLGTRLAHDDGEVGDQHHHQAGGEVVGIFLGHAHGDQPVLQRAGQSRLADDAVEHADGGDTDLDGGEETRRILSQLDSSCRAAVALIHQFLHAALAGGDQRDFRHGEHAVQTDESEKYGYFHSQAPAFNPGASIIEQAPILENARRRAAHKMQARRKEIRRGTLFDL